ncbi:hypothetical protein ACWFR4_49200, partial [Streptomyces sp. NPDC055140]
MHRPNVIGDWREYEDDYAGIRVRVHSFKKGDVPPNSRDSDAKGLTYFSFRVTVENRAEEWFLIELSQGNLDVRAGKDGEGAFDDHRSKEIEGFRTLGEPPSAHPRQVRGGLSTRLGSGRGPP